MAYERFATNKRHLHGLVDANQLEHAIHERIAVEIVDLPERDATAEVHGLVGIAAGAMQRALTRDFDRQERTVAEKHAAPGIEERLQFNWLTRLSTDGRWVAGHNNPEAKDLLQNSSLAS
jgi:predicted metallopeptidase